MAEGYSRQAVFIDGDIILAEHGNLEFDKLVNVFDKTIGHKHDGSEGGGNFIPLLKDPTGVQDLVLSADGISGSVILNETGLLSNSDKHIPTQKSVKEYVVNVESGLQNQIDVFENSNHGHINLPQLNAMGIATSQTTDFTVVFGLTNVVTATANPVNATLETLVANRTYTLTNSIKSTKEVKLLNPTNTITGKIVINPGDEILIEPGHTLSMVATSTTTLEVI